MEGPQQNLIPISASKILSKCKTSEDIKNICREVGKILIYIIFL